MQHYILQDFQNLFKLVNHQNYVHFFRQMLVINTWILKIILSENERFFDKKKTHVKQFMQHFNYHHLYFKPQTAWYTSNYKILNTFGRSNLKSPKFRWYRIVRIKIDCTVKKTSFSSHIKFLDKYLTSITGSQNGTQLLNMPSHHWMRSRT